MALGQPTPVMGADGQPKVDARGAAITRVFDLAAGKYDLTVRAGPSFTTRREEAASQMIDFIQAYPPAAGAIGDILARTLIMAGE